MFFAQFKLINIANNIIDKLNVKGKEETFQH
jgi:hypothetical protein